MRSAEEIWILYGNMISWQNYPHPVTIEPEPEDEEPEDDEES